MTNDGLTRALDKITDAEPRALAWLRRIGGGEFASSFDVQPRRLLSPAELEAVDVQHVLSFWDVAG